MNLREAGYDDCEFIADLYRRWPDTKRGRIFPVDVRDWVKRFKKTSSDEFGLVAELRGEPIGFILYGLNSWGICVVYEMIIHESYEGKGLGRAMWMELAEFFKAKGVQAVEFDGLPGAITAKIADGYFERIGERTGSLSGLPLMRGRWHKDDTL